jgi:hypothetical protein
MGEPNAGFHGATLLARLRTRRAIARAFLEHGLGPLSALIGAAAGIDALRKDPASQVGATVGARRVRVMLAMIHALCKEDAGLERAALRISTLVNALLLEELGALGANFAARRWRRRRRIAALEAGLQSCFGFRLALFFGPSRGLALLENLARENPAAVAAPGGIGDLTVLAALVQEVASFFLALIGVSAGHEAGFQKFVSRIRAAVRAVGRGRIVAALEAFHEDRPGLLPALIGIPAIGDALLEELLGVVLAPILAGGRRRRGLAMLLAFLESGLGLSLALGRISALSSQALLEDFRGVQLAAILARRGRNRLAALQALLQERLALGLALFLISARLDAASHQLSRRGRTAVRARGGRWGWIAFTVDQTFPKHRFEDGRATLGAPALGDAMRLGLLRAAHASGLALNGWRGRLGAGLEASMELFLEGRLALLLGPARVTAGRPRAFRVTLAPLFTGGLRGGTVVEARRELFLENCIATIRSSTLRKASVPRALGKGLACFLARWRGSLAMRHAALQGFVKDALAALCRPTVLQAGVLGALGRLLALVLARRRRGRGLAASQTALQSLGKNNIASVRAAATRDTLGPSVLRDALALLLAGGSRRRGRRIRLIASLDELVLQVSAEIVGSSASFALLKDLVPDRLAAGRIDRHIGSSRGSATEADRKEK